MTSSTNLSRREFTKAALAGGAAVAAGLPAVAAAAEEKRRRTSPLHAPFKKMRLSLAGYSLRQYMQQNWPRPRKSRTKPTMTIEDFVDYCGKLKLDGTEPTSYYFPRPLTVRYLKDLRARAKGLGLAISGTAIGNDFCLPEGKQRQRELRLCRQWIDYAAVLGAPAMRIFAGHVPRGGSETQAIKQAQKGINECLKYAAKKKVGLALENHGGITATPEQMLRIVDGVDESPWFGVNFDSGNFRTDDPYRDLAKIAPYAINAQIKVVVTRKGKREPADLKKTLQILQDAGYRGWIALEYEEKNPKKEIPGYVEKLRELIQTI